jgi:hypothetical protein
MPVLTAGNTIYTRPVAKVMISVPDELLKRLAERELEVAERRDDEEVNRLLDSVHLDLGGADIAQLIREDRESH